MRRSQYTITSRQVQDRAAWAVERHLKLKATRSKCTSSVMLTILFAAAARISSIFQTCFLLRDAPDDETVRRALLATLPEYIALQRQVNRALANDLPRSLRRRRQPLAIDINLLPYHGQPFADADELCRNKPRSGTTHFHGYATAYVIRDGHRYTVALTPVTRHETMEEIVRRLLKQARQAGIRPRYLLLDRGFYSVGVIRYLQAARVPFIMPVKFPGRRSKDRSVSRGAFRYWNRSGWSEHTLTNPKKRTARVRICVACRNYGGRAHRRGGQRHGRRRFIYAFWGLEPSSYRWMYQTYRSRFAIETTYRQMNEARIRTTTRKPVVRFFFVALALILRNAWVWLHQHVLALPRRGRRRLQLGRLRFRVLLSWLLEVAIARFGLRTEIPAEGQLPPVLRAG
jgi:DDE family transposase